MSPTGTDRAFVCAEVTAHILATVEVLLRGEPFSDWAIQEGQEAMEDRRYRDTELYQVWAGELRGDKATTRLMFELAKLWEKVYKKGVRDCSTRP